MILLGLRQVGKTTISKSLFASDVKYLDLEKPKDKYLLEAGVSEYLENFFDSVVVIDEVQLLPFIFSELRPIIDSNKKSSRFVLLGSANPTLVKRCERIINRQGSLYRYFTIIYRRSRS
ncbi:MAG: AAA family ATPase [Saprospiraceae bacterium]|nr:AAA family ATPase [Saprospiraceae bacterium]